MLEGEDARRAVAEASKRTVSRSSLSRHRGFEQVSPEVGEIDEEAFDAAMADDADAALAMLADMSGATDPALRDLARRLAGRISLEVARDGAPSRRGGARMTGVPYRPDAGDIDVDASLEVLVESRGGAPLEADRLRVRDWRSPGIAWSLVVDRSGSMGGGPLATAAVAACAVALRARHDHSVLAFAREVTVVKAQDEPRDSGLVVADLLSLRGHGTTDLAAALGAARAQLSRSPAREKIIVVLSDCRATTGADATEAASAALGEGCSIAVLAPSEDHDEASALCDATGASLATVSGPSDVPRAVAEALDRRARR